MRSYIRTVLLCLPFLVVPAIPTYAAASAPPIFPPAAVFVFSISTVGGTTKVDSSNRDRPAKAVSVVSYAVYPVGSQSFVPTIAYDVFNFRSHVDATQYDNLLRMDIHTRLTAIAHPVAPNEWLSVNMHLNYVDINAGLVYRNLELNVGTEIDYRNLAYKKQQQIAQQGILPVLAMEVRLLARAQAFAAHPFKASPPAPNRPPSTSSLTAAEQARNKAFRVMVNYWSNFIPPCTTGINALINEFTKHSYSNLDALGGDVDTVISACDQAIHSIYSWQDPNPPISPPPPPYYLIAPLYNKANKLAFFHLVDAYIHTFVQYGLLTTIMKDNVSLQRNNGSDFDGYQHHTIQAQIPPTIKAEQQAQDTLISLVRQWHYSP